MHTYIQTYIRAHARTHQLPDDARARLPPDAEEEGAGGDADAQVDEEAREHVAGVAYVRVEIPLEEDAELEGPLPEALGPGAVVGARLGGGGEERGGRVYELGPRGLGEEDARVLLAEGGGRL
jgi:hypothetical protein